MSETLADVGVSMALTVFSIILVSLLVFIMLKSMRAYVDVQQSVSLNASCDGAGFEREQPRWRMMFDPPPKPLTCNNTPHVMFNRAYDIFFKWYGKIDKSIIGLGVIIAVVCCVLLMISVTIFPDHTKYWTFLQLQWIKIYWTRDPLEVIPGINNLLYGFYPFEYLNRPIFTWDTWKWVISDFNDGIGVMGKYNNHSYLRGELALGILFAISVNFPWAVVSLLWFLPQLLLQLLWLTASWLKGLQLFDTHYAHINFVVVVVLLLLYSLFTRMFLNVDQDALAQWRAELDPNTCGPSPASLVKALAPILNASQHYQSALWAMGQAWLTVAQPVWQEFTSTLEVGMTPDVLAFRTYVSQRAVTIPTYNSYALILDWLTRVQTNLQVSDADFGQLLYIPLTAFFDGLLVSGTDDGNPNFDTTTPTFDASGNWVSPGNVGKCGINAALMGYMVYDADFMQNVKGASPTLYHAMAAVRTSAPEVEFSKFFTRKTMWAAVFIAIIAYLSLLRWNDVAVYYTLLATLCIAGGSAFAYVVLHLVRTRRG